MRGEEADGKAEARLPAMLRDSRPERPSVLYAKTGDVHIAYAVVGTGPHDLVWTPGAVSPLEMTWEFPTLVEPIRRAAEFARVIVFDKRGTGMCDWPAGIATLEERMDDIRAVMDAASCERAHVFGISEVGCSGSRPTPGSTPGRSSATRPRSGASRFT